MYGQAGREQARARLRQPPAEEAMEHGWRNVRALGEAVRGGQETELVAIHAGAAGGERDVVLGELGERDSADDGQHRGRELLDLRGPARVAVRGEVGDRGGRRAADEAGRDLGALGVMRAHGEIGARLPGAAELRGAIGDPVASGSVRGGRAESGLRLTDISIERRDPDAGARLASAVQERSSYGPARRRSRALGRIEVDLDTQPRIGVAHAPRQRSLGVDEQPFALKDAEPRGRRPRARDTLQGILGDIEEDVARGVRRARGDEVFAARSADPGLDEEAGQAGVRAAIDGANGGGERLLFPIVGHDGSPSRSETLPHEASALPGTRPCSKRTGAPIAAP